MELKCLETILDYGMTPQEAKAYKINCLFIEIANKTFPGMKPFTYGKGDPRKKYLFKVCIKLVRDIQHRIIDKEYPLYVKAQMDIIRINNQRSGSIPNISASCLIGPKAWNRWLVWKRLYDKKRESLAINAKEAGVDHNEYENIISIIKKDKESLLLKLKELTKESTQQAVSGRAMLRWLAIRYVSPYYALLSPILNAWLDSNNMTLESSFHIDFDFYRPGITPQVQKFFNTEFAHEF